MSTGPGRAAEAPRDQQETAFTPLLRKVRASCSAVSVVVLVDGEGEAVDYASALDPFEAKVMAAQLQVTSQRIVEGFATMEAGVPFELEIAATDKHFAMRWLDPRYMLVALVEGDLAAVPRALSAMELVLDELRIEAGMDLPEWDPTAAFTVQVRASAGWGYAPNAYAEWGYPTGVTAVIGRWSELSSRGTPLVCFRVVNERDEELTLAFDVERRQWAPRRGSLRP